MGFKIKKSKTLCFSNILYELYQEQDNSFLINNKIDIYKSIYANDEFNLNKMLSKDNIQRFRTKAKIRSRNLDTVKNLSRLGTQKSQKLGQLRFNRRISKTLDSKAIEFLLKNYNPRAPRRVSVDRKSKAIDLHLLKKTFFLLNYLTGNNEIFDENDFTKLFMDFFFQLINNFKKFKVLSVNSDLMEDIIQRTQQSKLQTEEPRSVI